MTRTKPVVVLLATLVAFAVLNGCGDKRHRAVACASEVTEYAQKSSGSSSSGRSSSSPSASSRSASAPSAQHSTAAKNQAKPPAAQNQAKSTPAGQNKSAAPNQSGQTDKKTSSPKAQNSAKVTPPGEKAYKPPPADVRPPAKKYDAAAKAAPARVSRNGSYRSPVTNHTYVYHDPLWYSSPSYRLDLYDPFNPWNYTNPFSPFYGRQYVVVDRC